jgi:hypothetical protein
MGTQRHLAAVAAKGGKGTLHSRNVTLRARPRLA